MVVLHWKASNSCPEYQAGLHSALAVQVSQVFPQPLPVKNTVPYCPLVACCLICSSFYPFFIFFLKDLKM